MKEYQFFLNGDCSTNISIAIIANSLEEAKARLAFLFERYNASDFITMEEWGNAEFY